MIVGADPRNKRFIGRFLGLCNGILTYIIRCPALFREPKCRKPGGWEGTRHSYVLPTKISRLADQSGSAGTRLEESGARIFGHLLNGAGLMLTRNLIRW